MNNKHNLSFTVLESTVVLLITTVILGTVFSLSNITKGFKKFQENIFLFNQDLKLALNLSIKGGEFNLLGTTSTLCGVGIVIDNQNKNYYLTAYVTSSASEIIDCFEISSSSPEEFNLANYPDRRIYISQNENFTSNINESLKRNLEFINEIKLATDSINEIEFDTTSIIFINPSAEPLVYYTTTSRSVKLNFDNFFQIIFIKDNERATTKIFKTGKITSQ